MRKSFVLFFGLSIAAIAAYACSTDSTTTNPSADSGSYPYDSSMGDTSTADSSTPDTYVPPFTPTALGSKLVLWLEADVASFSGDAGVMWKDKSGVGNNAWQDASARQPAFMSAATDASVNGHGVVRFSGNQFLAIADHASIQWGASDFAMYMVTRYTNTPGSNYAILYGKWTDVGPTYPGFFLWANYPGSHTGFVTRLDTTREIYSDAGMNDGKLRLVGARKTGSRFELRVSGAKTGEIPDTGTYDAAPIDSVGLAAVLGGRLAATQALQGDIAEVIGVKGTLSDAEQTTLETYLSTKYGL